MLLYHFPLNTQESIENFTNKGIKNEIEFISNEQKVVANEGMVSQKSLYNTRYTNGWFRFRCYGLQHNKGSICFRMKLDNSYLVNWATFIQFFGEENDGGMYRYYADSNNRLQDGGFVITYSTDEQWRNYVYTYEVVNGTLIGRWYIDGVLSLTRNNYIISYIDSIVFGGRYVYNALQNLKCYCQDIRIYDHALSQSEINEYSRAMVVHYPLQGNELNTSVLKDVSGFGNDTFGEGTTQFQYQLDKLRGDKIAHFVGSKQQYKVGELISCLANDFSISLWFTANQITTYQFLFSQGRNWIGETNDNYGVNVAISSEKLQVFIAKTIINVDTLTEGQSYHIAFSHSNGVVKTYLNGELKTTTNIATIEFKSSNTPNVFCVGKVAYGYNAANEGYYPTYCDICDIRVYATALSAEDIKNLYNSPISVSKQHQTMAFEFNENPLYPSKYWRTPTYAEMNYILTQRTNAANLRTLGRVEISSGVYRNGCFLLPDDWVLPSGVTMQYNVAANNYTTNSYTLSDYIKIIQNGAVFFPNNGRRDGTTISEVNLMMCVPISSSRTSDCYRFYCNYNTVYALQTIQLSRGQAVRLIHNGTHFSASATTKIDFAPANLQYHCTRHIWRFAEHSYDIIGADNANISDSYNGWIDLFGYGTSGVNYSPTLHSTTNSDYASGDIANTDNDWGVNEIQSYDYNVKNFALNKNGIVQHNELRENDSEVNGCYNNKLITNELIEQ